MQTPDNEYIDLTDYLESFETNREQLIRMGHGDMLSPHDMIIAFICVKCKHKKNRNTCQVHLCEDKLNQWLSGRKEYSDIDIQGLIIDWLLRTT